MSTILNKITTINYKAAAFPPLRWLLVWLIISVALPSWAQEQEEDEDYESLAQDEIDSILSLITPQTPDSILAKQYFMVSSITENVDTTLKYALLAINICPPNDYSTLAKSYGNAGWAYHNSGNYKEAAIYTLRSAEIFAQNGDSTNIIVPYLLLSRIYEQQNLTDSIFFYLNQALDISINIKDTTYMSLCLSSLGQISFNKHYLKSAEKYFTNAMLLDSASGNMLGAADNIQWLGNICLEYADSSKNQKYAFKAKDYFIKAANIHESSQTDVQTYILSKYDNYGDLAHAYILLAQLTNETKYADSCIRYYKMAEKYILQQGFYEYYFNLSNTYTDYLLFFNRYSEAEKHLISLEKYFNEETSLLYKREHHEKLKRVYAKLGNWQKAYEHLELVHQYSSAISNDSTIAALADSKAREAVAVEKVKLEDAKILFKEHRSKMITIISFLVAILVLIAVLTAFILHNLKIKKKNNAELILKNELLNNQKAEIEAQRDEIESQKNIIAKQLYDVDQINSKLFKSINYARLIQRAAVSSLEDVRWLFPESFVYYRPRDIVSGDFYRAETCGKYSVIVTADCTGHGIPGAFLSMLGISALKEFMVTEQDAELPGTVLDRMRAFVKSTLVSDKENGFDFCDGMDMSIFCIDTDTMEAHYAIANQKIYIIRNGKPIKLLGDNMPVGRYALEREHFQSLTINLLHNDMVYMFTDGIVDQLSDKTQKKFLIRNLIATLISFADKPADTQYQILDKTIDDWRGANPQMDDMTLVGFRV